MRDPFDISIGDLIPSTGDPTLPTPYQRYVGELKRFYGAAEAARILNRPVLYIYRTTDKIVVKEAIRSSYLSII